MAEEKLTYERLLEMVEGKAVAIRGRTVLVPAGGPGDKVFPPTHSVDKNAKDPGAKYAWEDRRINGQDVKCVLLDSVQSQANRMEEALESLWKAKRLPLPVIKVDLTSCAPELGAVTSLTAPHRIADALLRDSTVNGNTLFRLSDLGRSLTDAGPRDATPLFKVCPTSLIFGLWDSTGPKPALGAKFPRAIVSEIVGVGAAFGVKTASRIDPARIVSEAAEIFEAKDPAEGWTIDPDKARLDDKKKPVKKGVTEVNHSNIAPTIDSLAGGVTIDYAIHTVVLSLATLRKLQFPEGETEVRTTLASLALVAILANNDRGYDLRSRCLLVPKTGEALKLESIHKDGTTEPLDLDLDTAIRIYESSLGVLPKSMKLDWKRGEPLATLTPSPKLAHLIRESLKRPAAGRDNEDE